MKHSLKIALLALPVAMLVLADEKANVDPDLPLAPKEEKKNPYLLKSNPPTAIFGIYSDLNRIRWLTVPPDSTKGLDQKKCDEISDTYIAHCLKLAKEATEKKDRNACDKWADYGWALMFRSRWDDAIKAYEMSISVASNNQQSVARALYEIADCHFGAGREEEAKKTLHDLVSRNYKTGGWAGRHRLTNWNFVAGQALHWLDGNSLNGLSLPRWTGCRAFPEPQKSEYFDKYTAAPKVTVKAVGIAPDDARFRFFRRKLNLRGVETPEKGGYVVEVALDPAAPVDKPEGYTLKSGEKGAVIRARDRQGVLWGLVSFLQIYDWDQKRMRHASLEDWPDCPKRGYLGRCCVDECEFMLFNKMNITTAKPNFISQGIYTPLNLYKTKCMAREFNDLGLELYYGFAPFTMDLCWPLCWNVFLEMQVENAKIWASCGVGIYYPYDDARYWDDVYKQEDKDTGRKPSDFDVEHLLKFYTRVKAEYPDFKMEFCPPFYWGPSAGHPYPDDRTKYLKSLQKLPNEVSIFWTGERVGSHRKNKAHRDWYANLIGRSPSLFQNKAGPHYYLSYVLDEMPWDKWYYPGFVSEDMRSIQKNSDTPQDYPILSTLADYLWNVKAYDRQRAVERGLDQYAGKGVYATLKPAYDKLCHLDAYKYGRIHSGVLHENLAEWEQASQEIHEATEKAREIAGPRVMRGFGSWETALRWFDGVVKYIRKPPDYHKKYAGPYAVLKEHLAKDEKTAYDETKGDIFIDPLYDMLGVAAEPYPSTKKQPILPTSSVAACFYENCCARFSFKLEKVPAEGMKLWLSGVSTGYPKTFSVELNGETVYAGVNPFFVRGGRGAWTTVGFDLPAKNLVKGDNLVVMRNNSGSGYPIWIEYAVVKERRDAAQGEGK